MSTEHNLHIHITLNIKSKEHFRYKENNFKNIFLMDVICDDVLLLQTTKFLIMFRLVIIDTLELSVITN